jgi:biopolymer transport protein ExbB
MYELFKAGGIMMWPILICSIVGLAIVAERFWVLHGKGMAPAHILPDVQKMLEDRRLTMAEVRAIRDGSPLGRVLAAGLLNMTHGREIMKEAIEDAGRQVVHELERYLQALGTIASIAPLLGLTGTVLGMIKMFGAIASHGVGNPSQLAGGISEALVATAAGLFVSIPALLTHRYFRARVNNLTIAMEQDAIRLIEIVQGLRHAETSARVQSVRSA